MSAVEHFVVVDDEEDLLRSLASALRRARPSAEVQAFVDPVMADAHLARTPRVDALITDIRMPKLDGIELLVRARHKRPRLPAVVMTAFPSPSVTSRVLSFGTVEYLDKPFSVAAFTETVDRVLRSNPQAGFAGALAIDGLPDLVQLCALSSSTNALRVNRGSDRGTMWFERGMVVHAECGGLQGMPAFFEILSWKDGAFDVERNVQPPQRTFSSRATELLIEALRRQDEASRSGSGDGEIFTEDLDLDLSLEAFDEPETPQPEDPDDSPVTAKSSPVEAAVAKPKPKEQPVMASNIQNNLERLRSIDGYLGSALVDSESGMTLGTDGGGAGLNLEVAAAGNTEVVRAKRKTMKSLGLKDEIEDMLISLGRQYHVIRPLRARPGVFYYVVVDRTRANLAMARMAIADTEKALEL
jgi:DNA-binding response OmpR family regulator